jgi:hypothetical protein
MMIRPFVDDSPSPLSIQAEQSAYDVVITNEPRQSCSSGGGDGERIINNDQQHNSISWERPSACCSPRHELEPCESAVSDLEDMPELEHDNYLAAYQRDQCTSPAITSPFQTAIDGKQQKQEVVPRKMPPDLCISSRPSTSLSTTKYSTTNSSDIEVELPPNRPRYYDHTFPDPAPHLNRGVRVAHSSIALRSSFVLPSHSTGSHVSPPDGENAIKYTFNPKSQEWLSCPISIRIDEHAFQEGSLRYVFHMKDLTNPAGPSQDFVAKCSKDRHEPVKEYFLDCEMQSRAGQLAEEFSQQYSMKKIAFLKASVLELTDRVSDSNQGRLVFCIEPYIPGTLTKFNNNFGWVNYNVPYDIPQAFSHFTYQFSKNTMLVVDVQGFRNNNADTEYYTDPQIHSDPSLKPFGKADMRSKGFDKFFETHFCNEVCRFLQLIPHPRLANYSSSTPSSAPVQHSARAISGQTPPTNSCTGPFIPRSMSAQNMGYPSSASACGKSNFVPQSNNSQQRSVDSNQAASTKSPNFGLQRPPDNFPSYASMQSNPNTPSFQNQYSPSFFAQHPGAAMAPMSMQGGAYNSPIRHQWGPAAVPRYGM